MLSAFWLELCGGVWSKSLAERGLDKASWKRRDSGGKQSLDQHAAFLGETHSPWSILPVGEH